MALPVIDTPRYELTLPSEERVIQFRPFLVKEEKIMLLALESGEEKQVKQATVDVVKACTFDTIDVENLPVFDLEYIFLQIRSKSVGEVAKFRVLCPDDKQTYGDVEVDISKVNVEVDDTHTNVITIDEQRKLGVVLKYPTLKTVDAGKSLMDFSYNTIFSIVVNCVDHIFEGDKVYPGKDSTPEELQKFFEQLPQGAFDKIKHFFETMPRLRHEAEVKNPKTGKVSKITFNGLADFFESASPIVP